MCVINVFYPYLQSSNMNRSFSFLKRDMRREKSFFSLFFFSNSFDIYNVYICCCLSFFVFFILLFNYSWHSIFVYISFRCASTVIKQLYNLGGDLTDNSSTHLAPYIVITYYWLYSLYCTLHSHDYVVTTNRYFLIPSPFSANPAILCHLATMFVLCIYGSVPVLFFIMFFRSYI